jgi:pilus assembly protein CpaC
MKKHKLWIFALIGALAAGAVASRPVLGLSDQDSNDLYLVIGEMESYTINSLTRVSVSDPMIADVADVNDTSMVIIGKAEGQTSVFYWDENGKNVVSVFVYQQELDLMHDRVKRLLETAGLRQVKVDKNAREGKIVLSGDIPEHQKDLFEKAIEPFYMKVINLTGPQKVDDLIQIDMQISELSTTLTKELGFDWFTGEASESDDGNLTASVGDKFNPLYVEKFPSPQDGYKDFFNVGKFNRSISSALVVKVNALIQEGRGRILSKPKLVVLSGQEASFLVGGEIPIRTSTVSQTGTAESVTFKNYGIGMTVIPTLVREKIDIVLNVEISDIDRSNQVGDDVAFTTRTAQTRLYLDDRETVVLAGLIRQVEGETVRKVPYLNKIPIMGALFRSRKTPAPNEDQEIVISLTPTRIPPRPASRAQIPGAAASGGLAQERVFYNPGAAYYPGVPEEMRGYVNEVQRKISSAITYPPEAEQYRWEGTVKLGLLILRDGTLAYASIRESSGYDVFDQYALNTARSKAPPYGQFPPDAKLQDLDITIPIVYSLDGR